jgi:hypothetical protein
MATREFVDSVGERWLVWDTRPTTAARLTPQFQTGWLTFESRRQLRRLAPAPHEWHDLADHHLERLCREATPVTRRRAAPDATRIDTPPARHHDGPAS